MKKVTIVLGSDGKNLALGQKFQESLKGLGVEASILNLVEYDLPLYSSRSTAKGAEVLAPLMSFLSADAFVFISPEYNGGMPPVLTNFIAWASTSAKDWRVHFNGKKAALASHSGGDGHHVLMAMRLQLAFIGMTVVGRQLSSHDRKEVDPKSIQDICEQLLR